MAFLWLQMLRVPLNRKEWNLHETNIACRLELIHSSCGSNLQSVHGRPQKYFQVGESNIDIFLIRFRLLAMQCKWTYTKYFTFLNRKENSQWKHALHLHFLKIVFRWSVCEFTFTAFDELAYNRASLSCKLQTTESELNLNYPQLRLWCSH